MEVQLSVSFNDKKVRSVVLTVVAKAFQQRKNMTKQYQRKCKEL
jgi:hypothetical protein